MFSVAIRTLFIMVAITIIAAKQDNNLSAVSLTNFNNASVIIFDLETSDISVKNCEICDIAAIGKKDPFQVYIVPSSRISRAASKVTNFDVVDNELYFKGVRVKSVPTKNALNNFIYFLRKNSDNNGVILVAHNCFRFDAQVIVRYMVKFDLLDEFISVVKGFADTLSIFKQILIERKLQKKSFSQENLVCDYLGETKLIDAHTAMGDVIMLDELIKTIHVDDDTFRRNAISVYDIMKISKYYLPKANEAGLNRSLM